MPSTVDRLSPHSAHQQYTACTHYVGFQAKKIDVSLLLVRKVSEQAYASLTSCVTHLVVHAQCTDYDLETLYCVYSYLYSTRHCIVSLATCTLLA